MSYRLRQTRLGEVATVLTNGSVVYGEGVPTFPTATSVPAVQTATSQVLANTIAAQEAAAASAANASTFSLGDISTWPWYMWAGVAIVGYLLFIRE